MNQKLFSRRQMKDNLPLILAFVLPVFVLLAVFAGNGIFPFGDNSFLRVDLYHQYAPFLAAFKDKLSSGGSLSYTWNVGLGTNFLSLYGYYLASPFNWLILLCPAAYVIEFLSYMVVFKTGLTGLFFAVFLSRKSGRKDYFITFFSIFYALSGYFAAYNWNIMWVDCIMLAPLILLGLEMLVKENSCWLYCISLGLCILSNYYISIMVCIFCVLYFIVLVASLTSTEEKRYSYARIFVNFCLFSLLAGGLAACLVIPEMMALSLTASGDISFPTEWSSYFSIFDMLARHMALVETEIGLDHWPNIYCGTIVLAALPVYLMNREIPWKEKAAKTVLLVFMLFSFSTNIPNYIWHGFHYPNSLPCRQSFLYIAVLLSMCYEGVRNIRPERQKGIAAAFGGAFIFVILAQKLISSEEIPFYVFYVALALLGLYMLFLWLYQSRKISRAMAVVLMLSLAVIETAANTAATSISTTSRSAYVQYTEEYRQLAEKAQEEDPGFYRFEKYSRHSKNDGAWVGYPSASIFSSTANAGMTDFYTAMGMEGSMNAYATTGMTPFLSAILNIKYILSPGPLTESEGLMLYDQLNGAYLYQNTYTLPVGFMVPSDLNETWQPANTNPVAAQNAFSMLTAEAGNVLDPVTNVESNGSSFQIWPEEEGHIYVMVETSQIEDVNASIGERTLSFSNVDRGYLLDLGWCSPDEPIVLTSEQDVSFVASAYVFRYDNLNTMTQILSQQALDVTSYSDTSLTGTIDVQEDGLLFTSIPYDNGWTLTVDGVETEIEIFADALISVPLTAGTHEIHLEYHAPGQSLGLMVTSGTIILICLMLLAGRILPSDPGRQEALQEKKEKIALGRKKREISLGKTGQKKENNSSSQANTDTASGTEQTVNTPPEQTPEHTQEDDIS